MLAAQEHLSGRGFTVRDCKCGGAIGQPVRDGAGGVPARCAGVEPLAGTCGACRGPPGGRAVDGVPLSLTVVAGIGDRTLVANDLAVLHPLVDAAFTVRVFAHIRFFPLASTWGSRPTSLHLAAQRLVTFPWPA
jgi:hypothetical protein